MIDTLLLDIDDTLLDFSLGERCALQMAFEHFGLPFDPMYVGMYHDINAMWWRRYDLGQVSMAEVVVQRFVELFERLRRPMPLQFAQVYEEHLRHQHAFIRGAKGFLQRMRRDCRLYAVSNGRTVVQQRRVQDSGLDKLLDGMFVSEQVGYHKPEPQFFAAVAAAIPHYDAKRTVLVGNSLSSDIAGGIAAGIHTVWYNREQLATRPDILPDFESDDYHEIEQYIRQL